MYVKFLKPSIFYKKKLVYCGDKCCSWPEFKQDKAEAGEEIDEWNIELTDDLVENVDYVFV